LHVYEQKCKKEFGENLKYSLLLSRLMHKFQNIFFKIFTSQSIILNRYLEVPAVRSSYKNYIKWLVPRVPKYLLY